MIRSLFDNCIILVLRERLSNTNISLEMDLPWKSIFFLALTGTVALTQLVPRLSGYKTPISPIPALFLLLFTFLILAFTWKVILYPKLFSSLRYLPRPSVSRKPCTYIQRPEKIFDDWLSRAAPFSMVISMSSRETRPDILSRDGSTRYPTKA